MRKTQLIALLLVAIMAISIIPAVAVAVREPKQAPPIQQTSIVTATNTPTLMASSTPSWLTRGEPYKVHGWLVFRTGEAYLFLGNRDIQIFWKYPSETTYHYWTTVKTNTSGYYYFTDRESSQRAVNYKIVFNGDANYYATTKYFTVYNGKTTTSIATTPNDPIRYTQFDIYGNVKNGSGNGLSRARVKISRQYLDGTTWTAWETLATVNTGSNGYYRYSFTSGVLNKFKAEYQGYPWSTVNYWSSSSFKTVDART